MLPAGRRMGAVGYRMRDASKGSGESQAVTERAWVSIIRVLFACAVSGLLLGVVFVALLALTLTTTSDARIVAHLDEAAQRGVLSTSSYPRSPYGHGGHRYDMYTDCVAFGMNLGNQEAPLLRRIAAAPTAGREGGDGPCEDLTAAARAGEAHADHTYLRFWHGYQAFTRPLMSMMPLEAFRRLTAMLFFAALIFFGMRLNRLFGPWAWAVMLTPWFLFSDFLTAPMVVTHAISLICAFATAAAVPLILERVPDARRLILPLFVFAAGAVYNFLNFLINPPLAPALIAFLYIAANLDRDERKTREAVLYGFALAFLWFAGFAAVWIEKWLFAAVVLGPDAITAEIARTVEKYQATRARLQVNFLGASRRNIEYGPIAFGFILASIAAAAALWAWTVRRHGALRTNLVNAIALMAPLAIIVFWVEANRAHSAEHVGFVSRSFLLFATIPLLTALKLWRDGRGAQ
jgi:hypothetical protein